MKTKITLIYNFILPAILMNSVGIVIMQMVDQYHVSMISASWLEVFKDGTIVFGAFLLASLIPKMGYKKSLLTGIGLEIFGCCLMAAAPSFIIAKIFFVLMGVAFAFIKVTVYSSISLVTNNENEHAAFLSTLEGFFMAGMLTVFWIFGAFMKFTIWSNTFWFLALACVVGLILTMILPFHDVGTTEDAIELVELKAGFKTMLKLFRKNIIWFFIFLAFAYVFVERSFTTWLPIYEERILHLSGIFSVNMASLFAAGLVVGRLLGGVFIKHFNWRNVLVSCTILALIVLFITIYLSKKASGGSILDIHAIRDVPFVTYLISFIALAIGSIYPILCSSLLSSQPVKIQSSVSSLIVIISALGGAIGARIVGTLFGLFGGLTAIKAPILPLFIIVIFIFPYYHSLKKLKKK